MKPVAFNVSQFHHASLVITLNGEPVRKCFDLNEAEGWVEGKAILLQGGRPASERRSGIVRVECPPDIRATLERRFAVEVPA